MLPMVGLRGIQFPSHTFYVDNIFIFFRRDTTTLQHLKSFLHEYCISSGQWVSLVKNLVYIVDVSTCHLKRLLSYNQGYLHFTYLGVSIFVGAPKAQFFQPLVNKICKKLAYWKGKCVDGEN